MNKKNVLPACAAILAAVVITILVILPSGVSARSTDVVAIDDAYSVDEDQLLAVAAPGVLANDGDNALTAALVSPPANGSVTIANDGSFNYLPAGNFYGTDSFVYSADDGSGNPDTATVTIIVNPVNDPPTAVVDEYQAGGSSTLSVGAGDGILQNDEDPDNDSLAVTLLSGPTSGSLVLNSNGSFSYDSTNQSSTADSFTYVATDGIAESEVTTVHITLTRNSPPVALAQSVSTNENTYKNITLTGTDPDNDPLTFTSISAPSHGILTGTAPNLTYWPAAGYSGPDSFTFKAYDNKVESINAATVSITVNDTPVAVNDSYDVLENTTLAVNAANGVLANDSDGENGTLIAALVEGPDNGTLTLNGDGSFLYDPDDGFFGTDSFTYKAYDGAAYSNEATVTIEVKADNLPPTANTQTVTTDEDTPILITLTGSDPDGDPLTFTIVTPPAEGSLTGTPPNVTYMPDPFNDGSDSFTFKVFDDEFYSNEAKVDIIIIAVNDPPVLDLDAGSPGMGFTAVVAAGGTARSITDQDLDISDPDDEMMSGATVEITNRKHGTNEILSASESDPDITINQDSDGDLILEGEAPIADYEKVLRSVKYRISSDVASLNKEDRKIEFKVFDGADESVAATSVVDIIQPAIQITISDQEIPIPKGTFYFYEVLIENVGDVDLKDVVVVADLACSKTFTEPIPAGGKVEYDCAKISNIQNRIDNDVVVTAKDVKTNTVVTDSDTGTVLVIPDIGITIVPEVFTGDVLLKGDNAAFTVIVENPSLTATLKEVKVVTSLDYDVSNNPAVPTQPQATACDLVIGTLQPGAKKIYTCTIPNVLASFAITAEATGKIGGVYPTENYDIAEIGVIDLVFEVLSDPFEIPAGTAYKVTFDLSLQNTSSVPLVLTGLNSSVHGDLLDKNNPAGGTCSNLKNEDIPANKSVNCSYEVWLTLQPPVFSNEITAVVSATSTTGMTKQLSLSDEAFVSLTDYAPLAVVLGSNPRSLVAPGGQANLTLQVTNQTPIALTLDALTDSVVGNVNGKGNCVLPRVIPGGGSYSCTYPVTISGMDAGETATHQISAKADAQQASSAVDIPITALPTTYVMMPAISSGAVAGEPNNSLCAAIPLMTDLNHYFYADDDRDWYRFTLQSPSHINVILNNFTVTDGQLLVYAGDTCTGVGGNPIGHNGEQYAPIREIDLGEQEAGTYYVLVLSVEGLNPTNPYLLRVETSEP